LYRSIPYTVNDVILAGSQAEPNPDMKFSECCSKSLGVGKPPTSANAPPDDVQQLLNKYGGRR
jgi:hypothetical protein